MKINTPIKIAVLLSAVIFILATLIFFIAPDNISIGYSLFLFFLCTIILIYYVIKKFFYEKIRIIYKNIYKFKGTSNIKGLDIETAEKEATEWANAKEKELRKMKKDENFRREFLGNVSHELKTPIFNIQGYIETLLDGGLQDKNINTKYLERTRKSVDRMINIVEDLEAISRLETERTDLDIHRFNIINLVNEVIEQLEQKAEKMNIKLKLINESGTEYAIGDRNQILQVFMNLVSNSIKYGKKNGITKIRFFDMEKKILIEIADNGIGIEEKFLNRLFERFFRVDKNRSKKTGGTGLGLSIVKHILDVHKKNITVRSTKGVGSTFSFLLDKGK